MPTTPGQMFANTLNPSKGWPSPSALDHRAKVSANVLYNMVAGQAAHLNSSGQLEPGVVNNNMGLFIFQGVNELDVNNAVGTLTGTPPASASNPTQWIPINPSGNILCLVAKAPFELETTEADFTQAYAYNAPVRAPSGNGATAYPGSGQLTSASVTLASQTNSPQSSSTAICGITSRGVFKNSYGQSALAFWPVFYPGRSTET